DYDSAITPVLSTEEPIDSLSIGDEHLVTISATESDEVIKSSVEDLIPIPIESEGIPEHMCDVPFHDNSPPLDVLKDQIEDFSESINKVSSIDDDSFSIDNINYVKDNLRKKLSNVHLLIANIEALKDNPTPSSESLTSLPPLLLTLSWRRLTPFIILCRNLKTSTLIWKRLVVAVPLLIMIYLFQTMKLSLR
nr:hypothetical protein [Tanacetum cinerariifolium]